MMLGNHGIGKLAYYVSRRNTAGLSLDSILICPSIMKRRKFDRTNIIGFGTHWEVLGKVTIIYFVF